MEGRCPNKSSLEYDIFAPLTHTVITGKLRLREKNTKNTDKSVLVVVTLPVNYQSCSGQLLRYV